MIRDAPVDGQRTFRGICSDLRWRLPAPPKNDRHKSEERDQHEPELTDTEPVHGETGNILKNNKCDGENDGRYGGANTPH